MQLQILKRTKNEQKDKVFTHFWCNDDVNFFDNELGVEQYLEENYPD